MSFVTVVRSPDGSRCEHESRNARRRVSHCE